jgi:hypothetical protein
LEKDGAPHRILEYAIGKEVSKGSLGTTSP